jgi:alanyl-tRNA synthetase
VVDATTRDATRRNHTATTCSTPPCAGARPARQAGGLARCAGSPAVRLHAFSAIPPAELAEIEEIVNAQIARNSSVSTEVRNTDEAIKSGAMALFGEKYGDQVRVVSIPGFSTELCGGTHTKATGDIGLFTITEEGGVAAGVRRIEAQTGTGALHDLQAHRTTLRKVLSALNVGEGQAADAIAKLQADAKRLARAAGAESEVRARGGAASDAEGTGTRAQVNGVTFVFRKVQGLDRDALRQLSDHTKDQLKTGGVVLASAGPENRVSIVASITSDLKARFHAGNIVKALAPLVGGKGGGRRILPKPAARMRQKLTTCSPKRRVCRRTGRAQNVETPELTTEAPITGGQD